jgi:CDP-diacylglycerol--glycerol-3-phosphate 3-phosphatidyltransferase
MDRKRTMSDAAPSETPRHPLWWTPNALTMARVALAPSILLSLLAPSLGRAEPFILSPWAAAAAGLLALAGLLDFADGRLARALKVESAFGRFWDPVADKLVVGAALVGGAFALPSMLFIAPAVLLLWRDALVTWLRTQPRYAGVTAAPSVLAKWKTATEYGALVVLLSSALIATLLDGTPLVQDALVIGGLAALWLAAALSLWTGWRYARRARQAARDAGA